MNGFITGRLLEPKTILFLDKVYLEKEIVFTNIKKYLGKIDTWMGIIRINSTTSYEGYKWVYASSGDEVEFHNWYSGKPRYGGECALLHANPWKNHQSWYDQVCHSRQAFICEFI